MKPYHKCEEAIGQTFGRLTVLSVKRAWHSKAKCICVCGKKKTITINALRMGKTRSCGCLKKETTIRVKTKHGGCRTPEYNVWQHMLRRCYSEKVSEFKYYGARGIKVCRAWKKFPSFIRDMGPRPSARHSLERKNNNGNYTPKNCCWATQRRQNFNKRNTAWVEYNGKRLPVTAWIRRLRISPTSYYQWRKAGHSYDEIFSGACRKLRDKRLPLCECGVCKTCRHRAISRRWYEKHKKLKAVAA